MGMKTFEKKLLKKGEGLFNYLPKDQILDWSELTAFADNKINNSMNQKLKFDLARVNCKTNRIMIQMGPLPCKQFKPVQIT